MSDAKVRPTANPPDLYKAWLKTHHSLQTGRSGHNHEMAAGML